MNSSPHLRGSEEWSQAFASQAREITAGGLALSVDHIPCPESHSNTCAAGHALGVVREEHILDKAKAREEAATITDHMGVCRSNDAPSPLVLCHHARITEEIERLREMEKAMERTPKKPKRKRKRGITGPNAATALQSAEEPVDERPSKVTATPLFIYSLRVFQEHLAPTPTIAVSVFRQQLPDHGNPSDRNGLALTEIQQIDAHPRSMPKLKIAYAPSSQAQPT
ncbi:hypothetical protein D9615_007311 [Tricholomella constricta]|uniref:Uncharacterized protein n=1 Tax=Tricholomella constricta TaxID=117010 RepID=A0A8H5H5F8_9AGAR|nr:hypothetical protein D9615_007311 [Tricholomella constricta]